METEATPPSRVCDDDDPSDSDSRFVSIPHRINSPTTPSPDVSPSIEIAMTDNFDTPVLAISTSVAIFGMRIVFHPSSGMTGSSIGPSGKSGSSG